MAITYRYLYNRVANEKAGQNISFNVPFADFRAKGMQLWHDGFTPIEIQWFATVDINTEGMAAMRQLRAQEYDRFAAEYAEWFGGDKVTWRDIRRAFIADKMQEYKNNGWVMYDGSIDPWQLLHWTEQKFGIEESPGGKHKPRNQESYSTLKKRRTKSYESAKGRE